MARSRAPRCVKAPAVSSVGAGGESYPDTRTEQSRSTDGPIRKRRHYSPVVAKGISIRTAPKGEPDRPLSLRPVRLFMRWVLLYMFRAIPEHVPTNFWPFCRNPSIPTVPSTLRKTIAAINCERCVSGRLARNARNKGNRS
jgi:hypothetical protein